MQSRVKISRNLLFQASLSLAFLPLFAQAQTITMISGNGQVIRSTFISQDPLVVLVRDANGAAVAGATVTWTLTGNGAVSAATTTTDAKGLTSISFTPFADLPTSFSSSQIVASVAPSGSSVTFTEIGYSINPFNNFPSVTTTLNSAQLPSNYIGMPGVPGTVPIVVKVFAQSGLQSGEGVPGVVVTLLRNGDRTQPGPTIACQEGLVYTDANGMATCTPVFGGLGASSFSIVVGGYSGLENMAEFAVFPNQNFSVVPGPPAMITTIGGSPQSGAPNTTLPIPLTAVVQDAAKNPLPGVAVTFEAVTPGTLTFSNITGVSDAAGRVSAKVTLGSFGGTVPARVKVTANPAVNAIFTLTSNLIVGGIQKSLGDGQAAVVNTQFALPLIVTVRDTAIPPNPIVGANVLFAVTQGLGTVQTANATTNGVGQAATLVTAGPSAGTLAVTATIAGQSVTFNLNVINSGPSISSQTVLNGAGFQAGFISPGSIASITGTGLTLGIQGSAVAPVLIGLPVSLAGVSVTFTQGGITVPAPIFSVNNVNGNQSVNIQVPTELQPGLASMTVNANGGSTTISIPILQFSPGLFEFDSAGRRRAIIVRPDGSIVVPGSNPALRGEMVRMYVTGLGTHSPAVRTNQVSPLGSDPTVDAKLIIGLVTSGVGVSNAIYARNLIGVDEIQWVIPADAPTGNDLPVAIAVIDPGTGNFIFSNNSVIAIQ